MKTQGFLVGGLMICLIAPALAQRGQGGRSGGGQQGGQGQGARMGQPSGMGQGIQSHTRQHSRIHANDQQQKQFQTCTQSTQRVRSRVQSMARLSSGQKIGSGEAMQWREQVRAEMQTMRQAHDSLITSLSDEQKLALQTRTQQMEASRNRLEQFSEVLDMELALEAPDPVKVKQTAREVETATTELQSRQREMGSDLGIIR